MNDARATLLKILVERSYFREHGKQFRLASGKMSDYYVECSLTTTWPAAQPLIGQLLHASVPAGVTRIGGPTMGADPMAAAVSYFSASTDRPLAWFSVRKAKKEHGAKPWLEGTAEPGDRVCVVEDVITSGGSLVSAIEKCREEGLIVAHAAVLVDREQDGGRVRVEAALAPLGASLEVLFTRAELEAAWLATH